jgi:hypothetical protein
VSTVLVMGGCGDYFDVADTVILMRDYRPGDATRDAREVAVRCASARRTEAPAPLPAVTPRIPLAQSFDASRGRREVKIDAKSLDLILYGREPIDLRHVEQLLDPSQTRAIGNAIHLAAGRFMDGTRPVPPPRAPPGQPGPPAPLRDRRRHQPSAQRAHAPAPQRRRLSTRVPRSGPTSPGNAGSTL